MKLDPFQIGNAIPETEYEKNLDASLRRFTQQAIDVLNGGMRIDENMNLAIKSFTTNATPGVETAIAHGLKRTPSNYIVCKRDKAGHIYDGVTAFDSTNVYVRSDVASVTGTVIIF